MKQKIPQKIFMKTYMKDDTYIEKFHANFHERVMMLNSPAKSSQVKKLHGKKSENKHSRLKV